MADEMSLTEVVARAMAEAIGFKRTSDDRWIATNTHPARTTARLLNALNLLGYELVSTEELAELRQRRVSP